MSALGWSLNNHLIASFHLADEETEAQKAQSPSAHSGATGTGAQVCGLTWPLGREGHLACSGPSHRVESGAAVAQAPRTPGQSGARGWAGYTSGRVQGTVSTQDPFLKNEEFQHGDSGAFRQVGALLSDHPGRCVGPGHF